MAPSARTASAPPTRSGAGRQLVRTAVAVFVIAGLVAVIGPLLSYRSDVAQLRDMFRDRIVREAAFHADVLAHTIRLLEAELARLASRPEVDPTDPTLEPEQSLLDLTHRHSVLFAAVAVVDAGGHVVWSEPRGVRTEDLGARPWMQRIAERRQPVVDAIAGAHTVLVGVPVERDGRLLGALVGVYDPRLDPGAAGQVPGDLDMLVVDQTGNVLLPTRDVPAWVRSPQLLPRIEVLLATPAGAPLGLGREDLFAAVSPVGDTGMRVVLVGEEGAVTAPIRQRFVRQLLLLISLQISAVVVLSAFVQWTYRRFVSMERRAVEQDRLVALGSASSLIAHEVKNSLNGLKAAAATLAADGDRVLPVRTIRAEVDRLQHLASSLLLFGKPAAVQRRPTALPGLVEDVVGGLRDLPGADEVRIETRLPDHLDLCCDPLLMTTAVHNVVRNAIEAAVAAKDLGRTTDPWVTVAVARTDGTAVVTVTDNAGGPDPTVAGRLFTPFASGRPSGIGLGLSMARRAMETQDGQLEFERTAEGSRFTLRLPVVEETEG